MTMTSPTKNRRMVSSAKGGESFNPEAQAFLRAVTPRGYAFGCALNDISTGLRLRGLNIHFPSGGNFEQISNSATLTGLQRG